ncbi:MAG: hypothetical protein WAU01_08025 [Saprospiraceae bacterium]
MMKSYSDKKKSEIPVNEISDTAMDQNFGVDTFDTSSSHEGAPISNRDIVDGNIDYNEVDAKLEALEKKKLTTTSKSSEAKAELETEDPTNAKIKKENIPKSSQKNLHKNSTPPSGSTL